MRGHRLPASARIGRVSLQVADVERSLAFYRDLLGFAVLESAAGAARCGAQEDGTVLLELRERPGAAPVPGEGRLGLYHVAYLLPDRAALGRFAAFVTAAGLPIGAADHLVSEAFYLSDPDGLGVEVYADRPRTAWSASDGRLSLATLPIDIEALLPEAGGERWRGLPPGTRVGHVHLQVGDLTRARAIYHRGLGLDVMAELPGALFLSAGGYHHHLGLNTWAAGAAPAAEGDARLLDWELLLPSRDDVDEAVRSLAGAGAEVVARPAGASDGARGVQGTLRDPWGSTLTLRSAPPAPPRAALSP